MRKKVAGTGSDIRGVKISGGQIYCLFEQKVFARDWISYNLVGEGYGFTVLVYVGLLRCGLLNELVLFNSAVSCKF